MKVNQRPQYFIQSRWIAFGAFSLMLFGIKLWLISAYANATPYWDQWDAEAANLYKPFLEGTLSWADLYAPHNEHRIFTTRLLALALLKINGIWDPLLQMVVNAILHVGTLGFCIILLSRVIGRKNLPSLLAFSLILFGMPYAWENTLAGFQSQFYFVLLFSIACLWLTVTQELFSTYWWGGMACAVLAFFSLASGVFALAASAVINAVFYVTGLRKTQKQLAAIAILAGLFMFGVMLTPFLAHHASLKASSISQLLGALIAVLSWPISSNFFSAIIRNLPALSFVTIMLWKRPAATDNKWFLLALVVWMFAQAASISYGRAVGNLSSRYLDLFAIGILINFACLISVAHDYIGTQYSQVVTFTNIWVFIILISLGLHVSKYIPNALSVKRDTGIAQEINVRNYLVTGNIGHLKDKPFLHIPYPNSERLASILKSPDIRTILPSNIRPPMISTSTGIVPSDAFVAEEYFKKPPQHTSMTWGSYTDQGDASTGKASIRFNTNNRLGALLEIPVAGYPLNNGIKIEIENNGQTNPLLINDNPKQSWGTAYAEIEQGTFSISLFDSSTTAWLAIGTPIVIGKFAKLTNNLLANFHFFILLGLVTAILLLIQCTLPSRT